MSLDEVTTNAPSSELNRRQQYSPWQYLSLSIKLIESKNEEIIKVEIKDSSSIDKVKFVQFTVVETDRKGGKYKIVNCYPDKDPKKSIIKTIKTIYELNQMNNQMMQSFND